MLRYLKAAFWVRERIPLLGDVPVNALCAGAFAVLGLGHPAFWLLGILGETAFLWSMSASLRFRRLVDAVESYDRQEDVHAERQALAEKLIPSLREKWDALLSQYSQVEQAYASQSGGAMDAIAQGNLENLKELTWVYLKLLVAQQHLQSVVVAANSRSSAESITREISEMEAELASAQLPPTVRASKEATLELLHQRLKAARHRTQTLAEIESDQERIETQFQLAVDSAAMHAKPADLRLDLELASQLIITPDYFGPQVDAVSRAEQQG
ncbi:MAG: hypothetical protein ACAI34_05330 [Verrucomicrobium sp.]|nr:hypothetical protein [Verrucomicrobium sp.]